MLAELKRGASLRQASSDRALGPESGLPRPQLSIVPFDSLRCVRMPARERIDQTAASTAQCRTPCNAGACFLGMREGLCGFETARSTRRRCSLLSETAMDAGNVLVRLRARLPKVSELGCAALDPRVRAWNLRRLDRGDRWWFRDRASGEMLKS